MKRPEYKRLPQLRVYCPPEYTADALASLAEHAFYRGSEDHKGPDNCFGFSPTPPRRDASVCDSGITMEIATTLLREAISKGNIQWTLATEKFPRYVFSKWNGQLYIGRLMNDGKGEYKGYPAQENVEIRGMKE